MQSWVDRVYVIILLIVMDKKDIIRIQSNKQSERSTKLTAGDQQYLILTEIEKREPPSVKTKVYLNGRVIDVIKSTPLSDDAYTLHKEIEKQHNRVIEKIRQERPHIADKVDYFRKIKAAISRNDLEEALDMTEEAVMHFPEEPLLLSYKGFLRAAVMKDYVEAEDLCKQAINLSIKGTRRDELQMLLPTLYLHLGRVYLQQDLRQLAIENFRRGLRVDPNNKELNKELSRLGIRRRPVIAFLSRENPINKYLGLLLSRMKRG